MPRYDRPDEPYYLGEVIGSAYSYHRPTCHIVRLIDRRNYKRLRDHKEAQALWLKPCPHCRPAFDPSLVRPLPQIEPDAPEEEKVAPAPEIAPITATDLADLRRELLRLLDAIDQGVERPPSEGVGARISRLSHQDVVPREVAACMRVITEMRNAVEYKKKTLSSAETTVVHAAWTVIRSWANEAGVDVTKE